MTRPARRPRPTIPAMAGSWRQETPTMPTLTPDQAARSTDTTATALRAEIACATTRATEATIAHYLAANDDAADDATAACAALNALRSALAGYIAYGADPLALIRYNHLDSPPAAPLHVTCGEARKFAADAVEARIRDARATAALDARDAVREAMAFDA